MVGTVIGGLVTLVTFINMAHELSWGEEHARMIARWFKRTPPTKAGVRYRHNPVATYRVAGPERKI